METENADSPHLERASEAQVAAWLQEHLWDVQEKFQRKVSDLDHWTPEKKENWTKEQVLYAIGELTELIDQIHWKIHRRQEWRLPSRTNIAIDIVDCFKYLLNVCLAWDIKASDFLQNYEAKSRVVEERWNQEFVKPYDRSKFRGVVMVDIDGVLADYANGYLDWIRQNGHLKYWFGEMHDDWKSVYDLVVQVLGAPLANELKHRFREEGGKLHLPVLPGAGAMLQWLREQGLYVAIVSARPYRQYRRIMADTTSWLARNELAYDAIFWEPFKAVQIEKEWPDLVCAFEDDPGQAASIVAKGFRVLMPNQPYNRPTGSVEGWLRYDCADWDKVAVPNILGWINGKALK